MGLQDGAVGFVLLSKSRLNKSDDFCGQGPSQEGGATLQYFL